MADFRRLTLKQFRALAATMRRGSVTAAARELSVTPPAITTQLKLLEKSAGAPIFDRSQPGFVATEVGRALLASSDEIEKLLQRTADRVDALRSGAEGSVVLGAVSTSKYLVPRFVASFRRAHPGIRIKLVVGNRGDIIAGIERNEYDLLIMGRPPYHVPLSSVVLGDHPHVLIAPPEHPLAGASEISFEEISGETFLAREPGSGTRRLMERFLERATKSARAYDIVEMGTNETIKQAVVAGLGIAIISEHTCLSELRSGELVTLPMVGLPLVRQWYLVHRSDRDLNRAAQILGTFLLEHRAELFPNGAGIET